MIWIVVDHDLIGIPQPSIAEADLDRGNVPIPAVEPEAVWAAAAKTPDVSASEAAGKATMGKGLVEMKANVNAARVVSHPDPSIHVRGIGVPVPVTEVAVGLDGVGIAPDRLGSMVGNDGMGSSTGARVVCAVLGKRWNSKNKQSSQS
jgi:hypothetical protein